jgi:hypothetical protein
MRSDVRGSRRTRRPRLARTPLERPVPRWAAIAVLLAGALAVAGLSATVTLLGHPAPGGAPVTAPEPEADPGAATTCPDAADLASGGEPALVDSNLLYDCPASFDGMRVSYTGEAVGALLRRRAGVWLQLNDDVYAGDLGPLPAHQDFRGGNAGVGVLAPHAIAEEIAFVGGPRARGDLVEVTGTFLRLDPDSREVAVIRAERARVLEPGRPLERARFLDRRVAAYGAGLVALLLTAIERVVARRRRRF